MARKLKTFLTQSGFFDLAVAAPSMKAALDAWGFTQNVFHQGFAAETTDASIIAAAMANPGVVLKRAVGSDEEFAEDAALSTKLLKVTSRKPKPPKVTTKKDATDNGVKPNASDNRAAIRSFKQAEAARDAKEEKDRTALERREPRENKRLMLPK